MARRARPRDGGRSSADGVLYRWLTEAADRGTERAIVYRDTYLSWHGLLHRVDRRAAELSAMDVRAGDWIGLMLGNVPDLPILALAASKLGATVVPLDPTLSSRDLDSILACAPLRALVTRPRGGESAPATTAEGVNRPHREHTLVPEARRRLQGTLLGCTIFPRRPFAAPAELEAVLFTSDGGGRPVGLGRTRAILQAAADGTRDALDLGPADATFAAVPLYQGYGFDLGIALTLRCGGTLVLEDEFNHRRTAKALRDQEVSFCPGVPSMYEGLLQLAATRLARPRARFLSGGSRLEPALAERFRRTWGVRLLSCYHTTAAGLISLDARGQHPEGVGKPLPGIQVRAGDGRGEGPLWVRGPAVAPIVAASASRMARVTTDQAGWLRTGDRGSVDRLGRVQLAGREDDLVRVDGRPVALGEVEACIVSFPKVAAARAEIQSDRLGGAVVVAHVVSTSTCAPEEIIDHCARNLASYKVPRRVRFVKELSA